MVAETGKLKHAIVLAGLTGSGKTYLLGRLADIGEQVIDLEALANHRGSVLGLDPLGSNQPSQKSFESQLHRRLAQLDSARPVWLECESARIGDRFLTAGLVARLASAPRILLDQPADSEDRVRHLVSRYGSLAQQPELLMSRLRILGRRHSPAILQAWLGAAQAGDVHRLVRQLLADHYDPLYRRSRRKYFLETDPSLVFKLSLPSDCLREDCIDGVLMKLVEARDQLLRNATADSSLRISELARSGF